MIARAIVDAAVAAAKAHGIRPAGFLALISTETNGEPFEPDGLTPRFLFERHVFYAQLRSRQPTKLAAAVKSGLAIPGWSPKTQYRDEATPGGRMALLSLAAAVDPECAHRATSWGLGQIMGFEAEHLHYANAIDMVQTMMTGREDAQLDAIARFLDYKRIIPALNAGEHCAVGAACNNYATVALSYNGGGYKQHDYDGQLRDNDRYWTDQLPKMGLV